MLAISRAHNSKENQLMTSENPSFAPIISHLMSEGWPVVLLLYNLI